MGEKDRYSIGEVARLSGVTVRTLQYYDNIGLLPTEKDASGRRYYSSGHLLKLQQVLFYRSLGLPLRNIQRLVMDAATPEQIAQVLAQQREVYYDKLNEIQSYISLIDAVLAGVRSGGAVQSSELMQLIAGLNRNAVLAYQNVEYSRPTEDILSGEYADSAAALAVYWQWKAAVLECVSLRLAGVEPRSAAGKAFAKKWIAMVERITQGRKDLLAAHQEAYEHRNQWPEEDRKLMEFADKFIDEAVAYYLESEETEGMEIDSD